MVEPLLILARIESRHSFECEQAINTRAVAEMAVLEALPENRDRFLIRDLGASRALSVPPVLPVTALRNALDNACRYSLEKAAIVLTLSESNSSVFFSVEDEGVARARTSVSSPYSTPCAKGVGRAAALACPSFLPLPSAMAALSNCCLAQKAAWLHA